MRKTHAMKVARLRYQCRQAAVQANFSPLWQKRGPIDLPHFPQRIRPVRQHVFHVDADRPCGADDQRNAPVPMADGAIPVTVVASKLQRAGYASKIHFSGIAAVLPEQKPAKRLAHRNEFAALVGAGNAGGTRQLGR